jgi:hypothetical protein
LTNLGLPRQALVDAFCPASPPYPDFSAALTRPLGLLSSLMAEKYANPAWIERL